MNALHGVSRLLLFESTVYSDPTLLRSAKGQIDPRFLELFRTFGVGGAHDRNTSRIDVASDVHGVAGLLSFVRNVD